MAREDKMVRDIRGRLKEMKAEGGKYFKGTAKLFLASTEDIMATNMPTFSGMIDMNRDLFTDAVRFMRNPADMTGRAISRAMGSEDVKSITRLGKNMLDDLKTGNLYDPDRDRTAFGERTRELLNNFGGVDMTGFQSDGSYVEPANSADRKFQKGMLDYQEQSADRRLKAQLDATNYSTKAQIANSNAQHQQNIRLSIKQHSQMMSSMSNMVTQQAATLNAVNTLAASLLDISRESHRQVMDELNRTNTLLEQIVENTTSPQAKAKPVKDDLDFMSPNGAIDIKKYLRAVGRNVNTKYNLSGTMNMMTGGMGARSMIDMLQNNPWMAVTTVMLDKAIPEYLKATMETTQQYLENFVPTMLTKLADRGRRFDSASPENKKLGDFIAGLFGVTPKAGKPGVDNVLRDPNAQAVLTNRTIHAIEQVIPMWLSRIYSGITGEDLGMYNYRTGRMEKAKYAVAREAHNANDYVSRMGTSAYGIRERARSVKFQDPEMDEAFQDYVYRYLNESAAKGNQFINPYASRDRLLKDLPQGEDVYKDALIAVMRSMPRKDLMRLSGEMQRARQSRNQSSNAAYTDLQESGMAVLFSGVLGEKETKDLTNASKKKQYGLDNYEVDKTMDKAHAHALRTGISVKSTNIAVNDILETLNRGIITYTYLLGDTKSFKGEIPGYKDVLDAQKASGARAASIARHKATVEKNLAEYKAEQRKERDALAAMGGTGRNKVVTPYGPNRTTFEELLEQQRDVNVNMSGYYTIDNPETQKYLEKQRAKANKDFIYNTLGIKQNKGIDAGPFRLANQALQTVDAAMFKFMFGEDVPEGYGDNENQVTSFMHTMELRLRGEWEMAKSWFSENIGAPLKNFFLGENSIIGRTINRAKEKASEAASNVGKRIGTAFNNRFGDQMDALKAKGQDAGSAAANAMMDAFEKFLYGDDKEHRGKRVDEDGNVTYGGFIGKMKRAGDRFSQFMFGPDANGDDHGSRQKFEFLKKELNIAAPDMIIGGGIGLLGSLFLPGGPILGAVLGMGTGLIKGSETFQKYLFGEEFDREVTVIGSDGNPIMIRDPKTHKLVPKTKTVKSRKGGLISGPIYDGIKQYLPKVGGGAAAGWILGTGILPGLTGHLVGGFAGSMVGLIASSDRLKRMLFGDEEDETGESGLFSKNLREKVLKAIKEHGGGMVLGRIAGGILGKGAGALAIGAAKMGLIPGVVGALVGPTIASIGSVVGFFAGPKLINMIFGEEQEVEVTDPKTGKKVRRKERMGGMFGKIYDATRDELVRPFAEKMNAVGMKMSDWFQESIIGPLARAMDPAKKAMHDAGEAISRSMANIGDKISASITNAIGMPLNEFMKEKVIGPLERITSKIFGAIGKALGTIISAPFKAMEYIFTGRIEEPSERDRKRRHRAMDRENKRQLRNAGKAKVAEIYGEDAANAVEKTTEEKPEPESVQKTPEPEKMSAKTRNRKAKTDNDRTRESKKKTKPLKKAEEKVVQSDVREQVADANKSRKEKRGKRQESGGTVAGKATGVGAKVNNGRIINRISDTLLDIRKDIAHIRGKIDSGISMNGKSDRGSGRRRPSVLGSILGLPFRVVGAAARGIGTVAGGVLNAGGKIVKGGVDLVGGILGAGVKVLSTAGNILISAVSGVATALGGIVNGMVHLATGAVGLIGNILGGMLNMAANIGIGVAKGVWNVATVVPRTAAAIIGTGAKAAGALIGGGLKFAGNIISAPFKLVSAIFGGGHKKRLAKARAQKRATARPKAAARPSGRTILGMGNGPDGPMPVDLSQFKVSTTQGDAIRVWMVGESESPAERIGRSKDEKTRRKEHKDEMNLQKKQLKLMDKMNKRQHRQAIFSILSGMLSGPLAMVLQSGFGSALFDGALNLGAKGLNKLPFGSKDGRGLGDRVAGGIRNFFRKDDDSVLKSRVVAVGVPNAPEPIHLVNINGYRALPVFIAGSVAGSMDGGPLGSGGGSPDNQPVSPEQALVPVNNQQIGTYTGPDGNIGPAGQAATDWKQKVRNGWSNIKGHFSKFRKNRTPGLSTKTRRKRGLFNRMRNAIGGIMGRRPGLGSIISRAGGFLNRFRRNRGPIYADYSVVSDDTVYSGPAVVGERGPELYQSANGDRRLVGMGGPEIIGIESDGSVVPNHMLPAYGAAMPGFKDGYNWEDAMSVNQMLFNRSMNLDDLFGNPVYDVEYEDITDAKTDSTPRKNPLENLKAMFKNRKEIVRAGRERGKKTYTAAKRRVNQALEAIKSGVGFTKRSPALTSGELSTKTKRSLASRFRDAFGRFTKAGSAKMQDIREHNPQIGAMFERAKSLKREGNKRAQTLYDSIKNRFNRVSNNIGLDGEVVIDARNYADRPHNKAEALLASLKDKYTNFRNAKRAPALTSSEISTDLRHSPIDRILERGKKTYAAAKQQANRVFESIKQRINPQQAPALTGNDLSTDVKSARAGGIRGVLSSFADIGSTAFNKVRGAVTNKESAGRFGIFKKAYRRINDLIARSKNPKDALDKAIVGAQSEEEVQAIRDVQQMDSGASLMVAGQTEKKKGLLQTIMEAFSGAGGGLKGLAAVGAALFPTVAPIVSLIGKLLGGIGQAALGTASLGTTALVGGAGTLKAIANKDILHTLAYGARTKLGMEKAFGKIWANNPNLQEAIGKIVGKAGTAVSNAKDVVSAFGEFGSKVAGDVAKSDGFVSLASKASSAKDAVFRFAENAKNTVMNSNIFTKVTGATNTVGTKAANVAGKVSGVAGNIASKATAFFRSMLTKLLNAGPVKKLIAATGKAASSNIARIVTSITKTFATSVVKAGASLIGKITAAIGTAGTIMLATAIADFTTGSINANEHFNVRKAELTNGMRLAAGLGKAISGLAFGLIPVDWLSQFIWRIFASDEEKAKLKENQGKLDNAVAEFNEKNGTNYTVEEFQRKYKETASGQFKEKLMPKVWSTVGKTIKSVGTFGFDLIGGAVKGIGNFTKFALAGDLKGLLSYDVAKFTKDDGSKNFAAPLLDAAGLAAKIGLFLPTTVTWIGRKVLAGPINKMKDMFRSVGPVIGTAWDYVKFIAKGDLQGLWDYDPAGRMQGDNALTQTVRGVSSVTKLISFVPTAISWGLHKTVGGIANFIDGVGDTKTIFDQQVNQMKLLAADGDADAIKAMDYKSAYEGRPLGGLFKALAGFNWMLNLAGATITNWIAPIQPFIDKVKSILHLETSEERKERLQGITDSQYTDAAKSQERGGVLGWLSHLMYGKQTIDIETGQAQTVADRKRAEADADNAGRGPVKAYNQKDHRWGNMAEDGCGPTAAATIASAYGRGPANPAEADAMSKRLGMRAADGGTDPQFFKEYATRHGFRMQTGPVSGSTMAAAAEGGKPVAVMGKGGPFGPGEHYMVLEGTYGRGKTAVLMDPNGGGRKTAPMDSLVNNTDTAIYSSPGTGRGWGRGDEDETGVTTSQTRLNNTAKAQQALVDKMTWLSNNKIKYSQGATQDPDKGVASCASTVGWAYRKVFGDAANNMSASTQVQSTDNRFEDIYRFSKPNQGPPGKTFDLSKLQPGDIVYMSSKPGNGHTEMYVGNGMDLSHGGGNWPGGIPEDGPNAVKLNEARQKKVFAVRRYRPFMNGTTPAVSDTSNTGTTSAAGTTEDSEDDGGDFLSKLSGLLSKFTTRMFGGTDTSDPETSSGGADTGESAKATGVTLSGSDDKEKIWKFLRKNLGLTAVAAAGVMGNFEQESGNNAHRMEADYTSSFKKIGFDKMASDPEARDKWVKEWLWPKGYKNASWLNRDAYYGADGHTYPGFGLAQWTGTRGYNLFKFAKDNNLNWADLATQLDYFANGANEFKARGLVDKMNADKTTDASAFTFAKYYEGNTTLAQKERKDSARQYYDMYKDLDVSDDANENKLSVTVDGMKASDWATAHRKEYESYEDAVNAFWQLANLQSERGMKGNGKALTGRGWGRGPQVDLVHNAREVTNQIASLNSAMRTQREEQQSATNVETMAKAITDAVQTGTAGGNSEALLQTIATTLGSMLELMSKMADKMDRPTGQGTGGKQEKASDINKAYGRQPTRPSTYPNGAMDADDIGADIIRRLTSTR